MTRYWQRAGSPGLVYAETVLARDIDPEADPAWIEVTVSPVVSGDVIEVTAEVAHRAVYSSLRLADLTQEEREDTYRRVRALAAAGLLARPRTVTAERADALRSELAYRLRTVASHYRASGRHGTDVDPRVMDTHIDKGTERVLAALGLTVEGGRPRVGRQFVAAANAGGPSALSAAGPRGASTGGPWRTRPTSTTRRTTMAEPYLWLRARADQIEKGETDE